MSSGADASIGSIVEFEIPTANSAPYAITAGLDGNVWFTEQAGGKVGRITPAGKIKEFPVPGGLLRSISMGPHGNVWFTAAWGIGRITPSGTVTTFPQSSSTLQGITAGPDENMWVVDQAGLIDRFSTAGELTGQFPFPGTCCEVSVQNITAGSDGNLWADEIAPGGPPEVDKIARITPSGTLTEFGSFPDAELRSIAAGPDGNLWFTADAGGYLGRISVGGEIDTFGLPVPSTPSSIAPGTDGNMWFTDEAGNIGQITPSGAITKFPLPTGSSPLGLAAGADGNVWFVDRGTNMIGRVETAQATTAYVLSFDGGFSPKTREAAQGDAVQWTFFGPRVHQVADRSGLDLFDSGPKSLVTFYSTTFTAAGIYKYTDPLHLLNVDATGKISIPVLVTPSKGTPTTTFAVTWASAAPEPDFAFDVQILRPGANGSASWIMNTTETSASFVPDAGLGTYKFRARLRSVATGKATEYSPWEKIIVK